MIIKPFIDSIKEKLPDLKPNVILDVGSRDLLQSIEFLEIYPNSLILAFEPWPGGYRVCYQRSLQYPNIKIFNYAISDERGMADFWIAGGNPGASSLLEPIDIPWGTNQNQKIQVATIRLDVFLQAYKINQVDIAWVDTQGTELKVLKGMGNYLSEVKAIHCEASPEPYYKGHILKDKLEAFLTKNNFEHSFYAGDHPYGEGDIIAFNKRYL